VVQLRCSVSSITIRKMLSLLKSLATTSIAYDDSVIFQFCNSVTVSSLKPTHFSVMKILLINLIAHV
jgi:hypothetical protein